VKQPKINQNEIRRGSHSKPEPKMDILRQQVQSPGKSPSKQNKIKTQRPSLKKQQDQVEMIMKEISQSSLLKEEKKIDSQ